MGFVGKQQSPEPSKSLVITTTPRALGLRRALIAYRHRMLAAMRSWRWWVSTILVVGFWVAVGWPVYMKGLGRGLLHTALALALVFGRAWRYAAPRTMQQVQYDYLTRKARLYGLLKDLQYRASSMSSDQIVAFQREVLGLIASYVRGHRADLRGVEIFVNLLVEDGGEIVVAVRNHDHRRPGARYPKENMLAWQCIESGSAKFYGDIRRDSPETCNGKSYRSVLVLPIHGNERVLGCVSIDSTRAHHFDIEWSDLERYLAPYVCLLAWTLDSRNLRLPVAENARLKEG